MTEINSPYNDLYKKVMNKSEEERQLPDKVNCAYSLYTAQDKNSITSQDKITNVSTMLAGASQDDYSKNNAKGVATYGGKNITVFGTAVATMSDDSDGGWGKIKGESNSTTHFAVGVTSKNDNELIKQKEASTTLKIIENKENNNKKESKESNNSGFLQEIKLADWTVKGFYSNSESIQKTTAGDLLQTSTQYGLEGSTNALLQLDKTKITTALTLLGARSIDESGTNGEISKSSGMGYSANGNINVTHPLVTPDNNKKYALDSISSVGGTWQQTSQSTTVSTALTSDLNLNGTFNNEDSKYRATLKLYNETTQTNAPTYSEYINNRGVEVGTNINSPLGAWTASSNATLRVQNIINRKQSPLTTAKNGIGYTIGASISRNLRDNTEIKGSFNATENMGQGRGQEVEIATTFPVNDIKLSFGVSAGHSDRYYIKPLFGVETNCFHISTGLDCYGGYAGKFGFKTIF